MPSFLSPFESLVAHFQSRQIKFEAHSSSKLLNLVLGYTTTAYVCHLYILREDTVLQISVKFPVRVCDPAMRTLAAEMVARANHQRLLIGRLGIDMSDGEVEFHIGHFIGEGGLDEETIESLFLTALNTSDRYFGALMRLIYGGHTPGDAIYVAELDMDIERADAESDA